MESHNHTYRLNSIWNIFNIWFIHKLYTLNPFKDIRDSTISSYSDLPSVSKPRTTYERKGAAATNGAILKVFSSFAQLHSCANGPEMIMPERYRDMSNWNQYHNEWFVLFAQSLCSLIAARGKSFLWHLFSLWSLPLNCNLWLDNPIVLKYEPYVAQETRKIVYKNKRLYPQPTTKRNVAHHFKVNRHSLPI